MSNEPDAAKQAVFKSSESIEEGTPTVNGYEWNKGINYSALLKSYVNAGFQSTNLGLAIKEINKMVNICYLKFARFFKKRSA